jgi:putative peptide maturation system protein
MSAKRPPVKDPFDQALSDAVVLLRELPRERKSVAAARSRFNQFKATHGGVPCDLLVDQPPGSHEADYDLMLGAPDGGTVALSWRAEDGVPWTVKYSDHWAANYVLSVNDNHTSIQSALIYLSTKLQRTPNLMEDLTHRSLIHEEIEANPAEASEAEIQKAVDDFRASQGLYSAAETRLWLEKMHLNMDALRELVTFNVQYRKLKKRLTAEKIRPHFKAHRQDFDRLTLIQVWAPTLAVANAVIKAGAKSDLWAAIQSRDALLPLLKTEVTTVFAHELPAAFAGATPKRLLGPERTPQGFWVGELLKRKPARLDAPTQARIEDLLFQGWLAERRQQGKIQWHWL